MTKVELFFFIIVAMQLPVVSLIVLFSFTSKTKSVIQDDSVITVGFLGRLIHNNPLRLIAIGLIFNIFYLITHLLNSINSIAQIIPGFSDLSFLVNLNYDYWKYTFEVLTASFFLFESSAYFISKYERKSTKLIYSVYFIILITAIYLLIDSYLSLNVDSSDGSINPILNVYNLTAYSLTSIYLYKQGAIQDVSNKRIQSNHYLVVGFVIWAFLQLWRPIGNYIFTTSEIVDLIGFSLSFISKCCILFGLFVYLIERLNLKIKKVDALPTLINDVSKSRTTEELAYHVVRHLTSNKVFNYDYAILSEVDYLKQKILYKDAKSKHPEIKNVKDWVLKKGIPYNNKDILSKTFRKQKKIHCFSDLVDGEEIDLNDKNSPLNIEVYKKFKHSNLDRVFVPIINTNSIYLDTYGKNVLAILEVGFYNQGKESKINIDKLNQGEFKLFIDNCSEIGERLFLDQIEKEIEKIISDPYDKKDSVDSNGSDDNIEKDNHEEYLRLILQKTCKLINADDGFIMIYPVDDDLNRLKCMFSQNELNIKIKKDIDSILKQDLSDTEKIESDLLKVFKAKSMHIQEVGNKERTIGKLFLFSENPDSFNAIVLDVINKISKRIVPFYYEKKFHYSVARLARPDSSLTNLEANINPMIDLLKEYYETPLISIWLYNHRKVLVQKYASKEFKLSCTNYGENEISKDFENIDNDSIAIKVGEEPSEDNKLFWNYCNQNNIKAILHKPLVGGHKYYGFINIHFKKITNLDNTNNIGFLDLVASKALVAIQLNSIVNSFQEVSETFTQNNLKDTLQTIANKALDLLGADPVILYKSVNGSNVFFKDVTFANNDPFFDEKILEIFKSNSEENVELAELIIKEDTKYFNGRTDYFNFKNKHKAKYDLNHFKEDFWDREKIQSMAAIRLLNKVKSHNKAVGVMFINFRYEVTFTQEIKKIIETFAAFAAGTIATGLILDRNKQFLLKNLRLSKPILGETLLRQALHDAKKRSDLICTLYDDLVNRIDNARYHSNKMEVKDIRAELKDFDDPMIQLDEAFDKIESFYKLKDTTYFVEGINLSNLIKKQTSLLDSDFRNKGIHIEDSYLNENILIDCDKGQIEMVILNVLNNAIKASNKKRGLIDIRLKTIGNERVKLEIIDNGIGLPEDIKDIIFEPNITVDGTGFGLPSCRYIVETIHRGNISGVTKNGKTTFTITLPIKQVKE